jgi:hypothetical protein
MHNLYTNIGFCLLVNSFQWDHAVTLPQSTFGTGGRPLMRLCACLSFHHSTIFKLTNEISIEFTVIFISEN